MEWDKLQIVLYRFYAILHIANCAVGIKCPLGLVSDSIFLLWATLQSAVIWDYGLRLGKQEWTRGWG